jgi:hypothetical protein
MGVRRKSYDWSTRETVSTSQLLTNKAFSWKWLGAAKEAGPFGHEIKA